MIQQFKSRQFITFLITGGLAALVNFSSRVFLNQWISFSLSIVIAYLIGMLTAFTLAKKFVFTESSQSIKSSAMYFSLINLLAIAQTWVVSVSLAHYLLPNLGITNFTREIAHLCGVVFPVFTSFVGHKRLSFKT